jgi:hypothetical protein
MIYCQPTECNGKWVCPNCNGRPLKAGHGLRVCLGKDGSPPPPASIPGRALASRTRPGNMTPVSADVLEARLVICLACDVYDPVRGCPYLDCRCNNGARLVYRLARSADSCDRWPTNPNTTASAP